jgi:hypothetical protein
MKNLLITAFFLAVAGGEVRADITVKDYQARIASAAATIAATTKIYIQGLGDGFGWANTGAKERLYCEPPHLGLALANYLHIIDQQIAFTSAFWPPAKLESTSVGLMLFEGLKATFPCNAKK